MKEEPLTSEEKLLRLIRKKSKSVEADRMPFQERHPTVSPDMPEPAQKAEKPMDPLALSIRALAIAAGVILIIVLVKYSRMKPLAEQTASAIPVAEDIVPAESPVQAFDVPPFDFYKQSMDGRDIFQAPWERPVSAAIVSGASAAELTRQLKLVGILLDKDPKAIVENLGTQQTFFVSPGESIGNAVVSEIQQDKVILIFGQEKVELVP